MYKKNRSFILLSSLIILAGLMLGCSSILGSEPVSIDALPVYPDAVALEEGDNILADTLAQNTQTDAAVREAAGVGGSTVQRAFQLPENVTWDEVNSFYSKELEAGGWSSGLGGIAGGLVDMNEVMAAANQGDSGFNTTIWSRDDQTLTIVMIADPTSPGGKGLLLSLSTQ